MNYKNFDKGGAMENIAEREKNEGAVCSSEEDTDCTAIEDIFADIMCELEEILIFLQILSRQEEAKCKFYAFLKKAVFAISALLAFLSILTFGKIRKTNSIAKTANFKN